MHRTTLRRLVLSSLLAAPALVGGCGDDSSGQTCAAGLVAGQLVITEILADPEGADDDGIEWFEVYNAGSETVSLVGVGLEVSKVDGTEAEGHRIPTTATVELEPGAYMTFGRVADDLKPEHIDYGFGADLQMGNKDGKLRIVCGTTVVDETDYEDLDEGHTHSLDGAIDPPDPEANDDPAAWCSATAAYSETEFGSPGAANEVCPLPQPLCGQCYDGDTLRDVVAPQPGQLVINEVMANSRTGDAIGEWFEVRVVDGPVDLNCLQYGVNTDLFATGDPKAVKTLMAPECLTVAAGDHLLFAQEDWDGADFTLDLSLVDSAGTNPNPGVFLAFNSQILDEVHYPPPDDGIAWSLDPDAATPAGNDDPIGWCDATTPFGDGSFGTPGDENPQCPQASVPGQCLDGDTLRDIRYFRPGDLLITEVFPDPGPMVAEADQAEWFEFYAGVDADLNGLAFGKAAEDLDFTIDAEPCLAVSAGDFILIAASDDAAMNGMLPAPDHVDSKLTLTNDNSTLMVALDDRRAMEIVPLDQVTWNSTADGAATQLPLALLPAGDPPFDVMINDDPTLWCDAVVPFGVGDLGTPKAENTACEGPPPGDQCNDPNTMALRDIVHPQIGDLLITEFLANPEAVPDADGEWFELFAAADFDLNGLEIGKLPPAVSETISSVDCLPVTAGSHVLLAQPGTPANPPDPNDPAGNGNLPAPDWMFTGYSLTNSNTGIFVGVAGEVLDAVTYTATVAGTATQLTATCVADDPLDPTCNDDPANWCDATNDYGGLGDLGTPQAANAECIVPPGPGECFDTGTMANRPLVAPQPGDLVITEFLANPSGSETDKEWFEVHVKNAVDLNDLKVLGTGAPLQADIDAASPTCVSANQVCVPLAADTYILIAKKADPVVNGNLPPVDCLFTPALSNSNDGVAIAHGAALLHGVVWVKSQAEDKSTALDPASKDPMFLDSDVPPWCVSADAGTPKQENPSCP
jgi:hypothetical protein